MRVVAAGSPSRPGGGRQGSGSCEPRRRAGRCRSQQGSPPWTPAPPGPRPERGSPTWSAPTRRAARGRSTSMRAVRRIVRNPELGLSVDRLPDVCLGPRQTRAGLRRRPFRLPLRRRRDKYSGAAREPRSGRNTLRFAGIRHPRPARPLQSGWSVHRGRTWRRDRRPRPERLPASGRSRRLRRLGREQRGSHARCRAADHPAPPPIGRQPVASARDALQEPGRHGSRRSVVRLSRVPGLAHPDPCLPPPEREGDPTTTTRTHLSAACRRRLRRPANGTTGGRLLVAVGTLGAANRVSREPKRAAE